MSLMPITPRQRPLLGLTLEQLAGAAPPPTADLDAGFAPAQPQHPGFFKPGGMGRTLAGTLGDVLMQYGGLQPVYAPMQRERQQAEQQEVQWQRRRQAENEDWRNRQDYENAHRPPPQPTELDRALAATGVLPGTPAYADAMKRRADNILNPMMAVQTLDANGNPAVSYVPRNPPGGPPTSEPGSVSGPPQGAVEHLRQNPALKAAFDQKYGPGMADRYLGQGGAGHRVGSNFLDGF